MIAVVTKARCVGPGSEYGVVPVAALDLSIVCFCRADKCGLTKSYKIGGRVQAAATNKHLVERIKSKPFATVLFLLSRVAQI